MTKPNGAIELVRRYRFSASHRYFRPEWSEEENRRRFGKCANAPGHGHNYRLTVRVVGTPDPATGFVVGLDELDRIVHSQAIEPLDHHHLNEAVEEFAPGSKIPSSENVVLWIAGRLAEALPEGARLGGLELFEDDDLGATWRPDAHART